LSGYDNRSLVIQSGLLVGSSPLGPVEASKHWLLACRFVRISCTEDVVTDIVSLSPRIREGKLSARYVDSLPEITSLIMIRTRDDNH
jgi:hypothetical protein